MAFASKENAIPCFCCREHGSSRLAERYGTLCSFHRAQLSVRARLYPTVKDEAEQEAARKKFNLPRLG